MPKRPRLKIVFAGGGTGGHRLPILSVYQELSRSVAVTGWYFGTEQDLSSPEIKGSGLTTQSITSGKLRRYFSWENVTDLFKIWRGWRVAKEKLAEIKPDVVFVKGGFVSVPVAFAAKQLGLPVVTHESDAVMGLANRLISRVAETVAVTFPVELYLKKWRRKMRQTGPILRDEFSGTVWRSRAEPRQIMVLGGSQGSGKINRLIWEVLPELTAQVKVVHQTGPAYLAAARRAKQALPTKQRVAYRPVDFIKGADKLVEELLESELVISRSGSTIFELASLGLPSMLIPLSTSAGGHQEANARYFADRRAAVVLDERELTAAELLIQIKRLLRIQSRRDKLSVAIRELAATDGASQLASILTEYARR